MIFVFGSKPPGVFCPNICTSGLTAQAPMPKRHVLPRNDSRGARSASRRPTGHINNGASLAVFSHVQVETCCVVLLHCSAALNQRDQTSVIGVAGETATVSLHQHGAPLLFWLLAGSAQLSRKTADSHMSGIM